MKRLSITLLLLIAFSVNVRAQIYQPDFSVGGLYYRILMSDQVELVPNPDGCTYYSGNIVVPDSVQYNGTTYKVTSIGNYAFNSANLSSLTLPQGIRSLGEYSFYYSKLRGELKLPDSLRTIGQSAFFGNNLLETIYIPSLVDSIGFRAFSFMQGLKDIVVYSSNTHYCSYDGVLYSKDTTMLLCCPSGKTGESFVIPNGVRYISDLSVEYCGFTSIEIPNTVSTIKNAAFSQCERLVSLHIPSSVTYIEGGIFRGCKMLTNLTIDSLNIRYKIVDGAIYSMNMDTILSHHLAIDTVVIPQSVRIIGMEAFSITERLKSVVMSNGVEHIYEGAFYASGLRSINLSETLKSIGESCFESCENLQSIEIPNSVTYLGASAFSSSGLVSVVMSDSVKIIPTRAFEYCLSLSSYSGGQSVERINSLAFLLCMSFPDSITFPETLKVIEGWAFERAGIKNAEFLAVVDTIGQSNFSDLRKLILQNHIPPFTYNTPICNNNLQVTIPCGATSAYMSDPNWSSYSYTEDCDAIEDIDTQSAVQVVAQHKAVDVYNAENYSVAIYDLMGRCHTAEPATGQSLRHYTLPSSGVYIVRVNGKGYKVVVR